MIYVVFAVGLALLLPEILLKDSKLRLKLAYQGLHL